MGSITKRPKAPPIQQYTPPPPQSSEPSEPVKTDEEISAEARKESLLRRSRGRFGTILTGFSGFLNAADDGNNRKTLLGE